MAEVALQQQEGRLPLPIFSDTHFQASGATSRNALEQKYVNGWAEVSTVVGGQGQDWAFVTRPGSAEAATLSGGGGVISSYGTTDKMICLANIVITQLYDVYVAAFFDSNNSKIYIVQYRPVANTTTKIGEITGATINDLVFLTEFTQGTTKSNQVPCVAVSYQNAARTLVDCYYSISVAGVFTASLPTFASASTSFPTSTDAKIVTGPFQFMNGHLYIATIDGYIYESQLTSSGFFDVTVSASWNALATVTSSQYPDRMLGVYRYKHLLLAVGQDSIEFWSPDNNNPPQPSLVRTDQAFIKFGGLTPKLCLNVNDIFYWVSYGSADTLGIWKLDNYSPVKISTPRQDYNVVSTFSAAAAYAAGCYTLEMVQLNNKQHLLVNGIGDALNLADQTWWTFNIVGVPAVYPATTFSATYPFSSLKQYFFASSGLSTGNSAMGITNATNISTRCWSFKFASSGNFLCDFEYTNGVIFHLDPTWTCQLNTYWFSTEARKRINRIVIKALGSTMAMTYSIYRDGINGTNLTGSVLGTAPRYYINNLGAYRNISLSLSGVGIPGVSDPVRIEGIDIMYAAGTH